MSLINVSNLTFSYDGSYDNIFENVSFQIDTGWKLGFIGRNGRGKTTFLKLLMEEYDYGGSISSDVLFEYFPYEVGNMRRNTAEIINSIVPGVEEWRFVRELNLLEIPDDALYRPFCTLSNGEQTKVLLAALFLKENSFLLIDEPTNCLDMAGRKTVGDYLRGKESFILVSHDRALLDSCVDHVLSINKTDIEIQKGNFSSWRHNKELQDSFEISQDEKLKKDIKRLKAAAKRASGWSDEVERTKTGTRNSGLRPDTGYIGHKSAKMMKRAKSIEGRQISAAKEKSKLLKNIETSEPLKIYPLLYHADKMVGLENVGICYDGKIVCEKVTFDICAGDRIALCGKNGSSKSSILRLICGEPVPHQGTIKRGGGLKISYVSQDTSDLSGNLSDYAAETGIDESLFKAILRKLDFSRVQFDKDMSGFSSGQKKKVLIARSLCEQAHLYVWDEPLNFIDVISRMQIEELLKEFKPTILFVEHDRAFCDNISTKTVSL